MGNIPYGYSEEQLSDIFKEVGPLANFRIVFDRETGKPKGYGFCEYLDAETASSAIRNLNNYDIGGRQLRVDYAENDANRGAKEVSVPIQSQNSLVNEAITSADQITATLASMDTQQLLEVITEMKSLISLQPEEAKSVLTKNPQLSYAIFQALLMMGLIDPSVIQNVLKSADSVETNLTEQQKSLLNQIKTLTQEQIDQLPSEQRSQIMSLKSKMNEQ